MALTKTHNRMIAGSVGNVIDFGADPTGVADSSAAFTAALAAYRTVIVPEGTFSCDSMIEVNQAKTLRLIGNTTIQRPASASSTDPVIWIKGNNASVLGDGTQSIIRSFKDAPRGVVRLGHKDDTESHSDVLYCTLSDLAIYGQQNYGKTTGDPDVCLYMNNPQIGGRASYFHQVRNILFANSNIGVWLRNNANANTMTQLQFLRLGGNDVGVDNAAIYLNGGKENMISHWFVHFSPNVKCLWLNNSPTTNTELNVLTNWVVEPGAGGTAQGMVVGNIGLGNFIQGTINGVSNDYGAAGTGFFGNNKRNVWIGLNEQYYGAGIDLINQAGAIKFDATGVGGQYFALANTGSYFRFRGTANVDLLEMYQGATFRPGPTFDGTADLGGPANRWDTVYAAVGAINTSDVREKQDIEDLDEAESRVAVTLKGLVKKFRFKSAVEKKGDDARTHVGVIAQEVQAAFEAEGLDANRYGILCHDAWEEEHDEDGNLTKSAGDRYGVRYEELLAFIISAL